MLFQEEEELAWLQESADLLLDIVKVAEQLGKIEACNKQTEVQDRPQQQRRRRRRARRYWVRPWITRRLEYGMYATLMKELEEQDTQGF